MASENQAAWLVGKSKPFEVRPADMPKPGADEVVVRNRAIAINPVDWKIQDGEFLDQLELPFIMGTDVAGEIYEVGGAVTKFKKGDRVLAHCTNLWDKKSQSGAFQLYSAAHGSVVSKIPAGMPFTDAAVLPLALSTAAVGLYGKGFLRLTPPQASSTPADGGSNNNSNNTKKQVILVWGGSSSVGAAAIQLARASGVAVVATASARNLDALAAQLGADYAFDHRSPTVVADVVAAVAELVGSSQRQGSGAEFAGAYDAISEAASLEAVGRVFDALGSEGGEGGFVVTKRLATVLPPPPEGLLPGDVEASFLMAPMLLGPEREVAGAVWDRFVPEALESGALKPLPRAVVVGEGLGCVQEGVEENKKGVSYAKIVVEIR